MKPVRSACAILIIVPALFCAALFAQAPGTPSFEVASIKPLPSLQALVADIQSGRMSIQNLGMRVDGARVDIGFMSLKSLVTVAYKLKPSQVVGPEWMDSRNFEIHAKIPEGVSKDQVPEMLQSLLAERFKLAYHRENKEQPVYALLAAKNGPKMKEAPPDPASPAAEEGPAKEGAAGEVKGKETVISTPEGDMKIKPESRGMTISGGKTGQIRVTMGDNRTIRMEVEKMTMPEFAALLTQYMDRQVIDETGLKGSYQVSFDIPMEALVSMARKVMPDLPLPVGGPGDLAGAAPSSGLSGMGASDPSGGGFFEAVQQLGLKLESRKTPVETLVIDHIEQNPTEN